MLKILLPWPPSINHYYKRTGRGKVFISARGIQYRRDVIIACLNHKNAYDKEARLSVTIYAYPPDNRRHDLDNICKAIWDSLEKALVFPDDSQIDELIIKRCEPNDGKVIVNIKQCW